MIIGLHGKAGVGKDTVANAILRLNPKYTRIAFADPLREACNSMFGWDIEKMKEFDYKERIDPVFGFSPRRALQLLGTEFGRTIDPDLWVKVAKSRTVGLTDVVFTDVRFENEAEYIREVGGVIIHVISSTREETTSNSSHVSESGIERHLRDLLFYNEHTGLDILNENARSLMTTLEKIENGF